MRLSAPRAHDTIALVTTALAAACVALGSINARAANPNALWDIVHGQCVPDQQQHDDPYPCAMVEVRDGVDRGYAVLKDRVGATQFLLIPTTRVGGIESPDLLAPDAPNYFADAWKARTYVDSRAHQTLPRESLGLAINSVFARSQNQLHIHIDCIRADVRDALREHAAEIDERWAPFPVLLAGRPYKAMRVLGDELGQVDPFKLLADGIPGAREDMGRHTLVVTGAIFADGKPGFIILDGRADLATGDRGFGEALQDHSCALAHGSSPEESSR
jgi:CDP-diacylglycerol pyrophosphatase